MKKSVLGLLGLAALAASLQACAQQPPGEDEPQLRACLTSAHIPVFSDFERLRAVWAANYQARRPEFQTHVLQNEAAMSRCAQRALRRDLTKNSRTTFGVHVAHDGRVVQVAMLSANHSDNLYAACMARTLCTFQLTPVTQGTDEVLLFNFNLNRKARPHERPWEIESHGLGR